MRVNSLKCLGVTLQSNFLFTEHINDILSNCASNLFALWRRTLKSKGLSNDLIVTVFKSTVLSKLAYASQFWWGFTGASDRDRLEAFLRKASRCSFFDGSRTFSEIIETADRKLFNAVSSNQQHVLFPLLPPKKGQILHKLINRPHCCTLPSKKAPLMDKNYIVRMLYKDTY